MTEARPCGHPHVTEKYTVHDIRSGLPQVYILTRACDNCWNYRQQLRQRYEKLFRGVL